MMSDASDSETNVAAASKKNNHQASSSVRNYVDLFVLGAVLLVVRRVT